MNNSKLLFLTLMIFSIMLTISSNSWISCWMGLELNTFSFLPFIFKKKNFLSSETSIKYFLIQSISSINLLFVIFLINWKMMNNNIYQSLLFLNIIICLLFKVGSAPFHFWMVNLIEGLDWLSMFIFLSIQKVPPVILISFYLNIKFIYFIIIMNCLFGSVGGLTQLSIRKIMTYSSIFNFSWMLSAIIISDYMFIFFMLIYSLITFNLFMIFKLMNTSYLSQLYNIKPNKLLTFTLMINLLSLGGVPPFLGFIPEWLISIYFIQMKSMIILPIIMFSLINLYYYIQMFYPIIFMNKFQSKWTINMNSNIFFFSYISSLGLIFINMFFIFY
uniref:NADH dehydrogenase subunit 2 n=1 Tax=Cheumatopsyche brevilineata TaxID=1437087 RepID=UPI00223810CD|nr:NADH dehydrogenase subunit 2 [Cheumatopsyche brevilineata]UYO79201.1 NADH dehydrogenase subunit 2 [Cheumatopsyche brevilineata]